MKLDGAEQAHGTVDTLINVLLSEDPEEFSLVPEYTSSQIQRVEMWIQQTRLAVASAAFPLTGAEEKFIKIVKEATDHDRRALRGHYARLLKAATPKTTGSTPAQASAPLPNQPKAEGAVADQARVAADGATGQVDRQGNSGNGVVGERMGGAIALAKAPWLSSSPPKGDENLYLSPADIAERYELPKGALGSRLKRWRSAHGDGWKQVTEPKPREPRYLYRVSAVWAVIQDLARAAGETTDERLAK